MSEPSAPPRLILVTPLQRPAGFAALLEAALAGGDVASVILPTGGRDPTAEEKALRPLVGLAQGAGAAALIGNDTRIAGHLGADGVHVDTGAGDLADAVRRFRPARIVGAGNLVSRHAAMEAGEADPDYVFFGRLAPDEPGVHAHARDLAAWWAGLFRVPAVLMAGRDIASLADAAATGVEFVAAGDAIFAHPAGPGAAVREANARLAAVLPLGASQ